MSDFDTRRIQKLNTKVYSKGPVVYWMQRDRRAEHNWALLYAQKKALQFKVPLIVFYSLNGNFIKSNIRQYGFLIRGLEETAAKLRKNQIPFIVYEGSVHKSVSKFVRDSKAGFLVTDFSPLKVYRSRTSSIAKKLNIPMHIIDAHNIVPIWSASDKQEYAAYTIRPKLLSKLDDFLTPIKKIEPHPYKYVGVSDVFDSELLIKNLKIDLSVGELSWIKPGEKMAKKMLNSFISERFDKSGELRNNPNRNKISHLSPYIHFGQISAQQIALTVSKIEDCDGKDSFLEQLIIRRELSENFCYYNNEYDSFNGFPDWAKRTLSEHKLDERKYIYTPRQFENAETHDDLWNAAQLEMTEKGKMHGYLRMYWAKKILEWSPDPETALQIAIDLNDKYELDGRDPNGYTGIAWSIGGVHDRPWFERPIFGKIRYMNFNGCKRKFNVDKYIKINNAQNAQITI